MADLHDPPDPPVRDKATLRDIRALVRARAREAPAWQTLDAALDEAGEIGRLISDKQSTLLLLADNERASRAAIDEARATAARIIDSGKGYAADIIADANNQLASAEARFREAEAIVGAARDEGANIVAAAKNEADRLMSMINQIRGQHDR